MSWTLPERCLREASVLEQRSTLNTALLGGAVVMSGLMSATDPKRNLPRRLAFAAVGLLLMGLYMLSR